MLSPSRRTRTEFSKTSVSRCSLLTSAFLALVISANNLAPAAEPETAESPALGPPEQQVTQHLL